MDIQLDTLARTIYGEARGEYNRTDAGMAGLIAVANVVWNRFKRKSWFGRTVSEVCLKDKQFSCWNADDPNSAVIKSLHPSDSFYRLCYKIAEGVVNKDWPDLTNGSDHYFNGEILRNPPFWSVGRSPRFKLGRHTFYQLAGGN